MHLPQYQCRRVASWCQAETCTRLYWQRDRARSSAPRSSTWCRACSSWSRCSPWCQPRSSWRRRWRSRGRRSCRHWGPASRSQSQWGLLRTWTPPWRTPSSRARSRPPASLLRCCVPRTWREECLPRSDSLTGSAQSQTDWAKTEASRSCQPLYILKSWWI